MSNLSKVLKKFPRVFWISNFMELFERWAWYGFYNAFALYLTLSKDTGALGFTQVEKGAIIGTGSMLLYFLPLITGAIADRIGFKKVLILSFTAYIAGYFMVGTFESFPMVFAAYIFLAVAGALFKPIILLKHLPYRILMGHMFLNTKIVNSKIHMECSRHSAKKMS